MLVLEGGLVTPEMAAQQCNTNQAANEAAGKLQAGDVVEVFGQVVAEGEIEVCSDERYSITLLETIIRGTVIENIQGVAFDANNELILETETSEEIHVLVMEGGLVTPEMAAQQCNQNQAANEATWELAAGDEVEVFGRFVAAGGIEVCSDERYTINLVEEVMLPGTVVEIIQGVAADGNNELILKTDIGEVRVLVTQGGHLLPEMAARQCNKNQAANDALLQLKVGDVVEVFGRVVAEGEIEVCSDERYTISPVVPTN